MATLKEYVLCRYDQFIPMAFHIIILGLFCQIKAVEFQPSRHFLFPFENSKWNFQVVISDAHAEGDDSMSNSKTSDDVFKIIILFIDMNILIWIVLLSFFSFS